MMSHWGKPHGYGWKGQMNELFTLAGPWGIWFSKKQVPADQRGRSLKTYHRQKNTQVVVDV